MWALVVSVILMGIDLGALGGGKSQGVLECNRWIDPFQAACRTEGAWPSRQDSLLRPPSQKRRLEGIKFVPLKKFGGARQISILPWADVRALVCEAGSSSGDYTLRVAGVESLAPWSSDQLVFTIDKTR